MYSLRLSRTSAVVELGGYADACPVLSGKSEVGLAHDELACTKGCEGVVVVSVLSEEGWMVVGVVWSVVLVPAVVFVVDVGGRVSATGE